MFALGCEHLAFYGQLKGIPLKNLKSEINSALAAVGLLAGKVGEKRVAYYSGGMRRRLCVAIALIGKPKVVYLDEPSTVRLEIQGLGGTKQQGLSENS